MVKGNSIIMYSHRMKDESNKANHLTSIQAFVKIQRLHQLRNSLVTQYQLWQLLQFRNVRFIFVCKGSNYFSIPPLLLWKNDIHPWVSCQSKNDVACLSGPLIQAYQTYKTKSPHPVSRTGTLSQKRRRPPTLPHCIAVPSAQAGLTSLFGMGRGGTPLQ